MIKSNSVKKAKINFWSARRGMAGDRRVVQISISEPGEEPNLIARSAKYGTDNAHNNLPDVNARAQSSPAPSTNQSAAYVGGAGQCCCPLPRARMRTKRPQEENQIYRWSDCGAIIFQINQRGEANILAAICTDNWAWGDPTGPLQIRPAIGTQSRPLGRAGDRGGGGEGSEEGRRRCGYERRGVSVF